MSRIIARLFLVLGVLGLAGCGVSRPKQTLAQNVDLSRYIVANIPYFAERGNVGSYFDVTFPQGKVHDVYVGQAKNFTAKPKRYVMHGYVAPDYHEALVGYPGHGYGWVLSRSPDMTKAAYQAALARFAALGYDPGQFRRVPQHPGEIGAPGFQ